MLEEGLEDLEKFLRFVPHFISLINAEVVAHENLLFLDFLKLGL